MYGGLHLAEQDQTRSVDVSYIIEPVVALEAKILA